MYCPYCGTKLDDDAHFCTACGMPIPCRTKSGLHDSAEGSETGDMADSSPSSFVPAYGDLLGTKASQASEGAARRVKGGLREQISEMRGGVRRKALSIPLIAVVVLAMAIVAFALAMVWYFFIAPALEQRGVEPVQAEAATTSAETVEAASQATTGVADDEDAQKAVFDDVLAQYKAAQDRGWTSQESDTENLTMLEEAIAGPVQSIDSTASTISYAFFDSDGDGILDLAIGAVKPTGDYQVIEVFASDGEVATSLIGISFGARVHYNIAVDGRVWFSTYGSVNTGLTVVSGASHGKWETLDRFGYDYSGTDPSTKYYYRGNTENRISESEYKALASSYPGPAQLDWHPLSEFTPVGQR